jgi:hypothetical protein
MFEKQKEEIDQDIKNKMINVAKTMAHIITEESPVWTGEYIQCHLVESEPKAYKRDSIAGMKPFPDKISEGAAMGLKTVMSVRLTIQAEELINSGHTKIAFNNKAKHARFVEHTGWPEYNKPPAKPFGITKESIIPIKKSL